MKIFIAKEESEYKIYKVANHLINEFKDVKKDNIVIEATSIQDAIIQFDKLDKEISIGFNSELKKFKEEIKADVIERVNIRGKPRLKVKKSANSICVYFDFFCVF